MGKTGQHKAELRDRLRSAGLSLAKVAAAAKIATRAIVLINNETQWNEEVKEAIGQNNTRKLSGFAASVTRLAVYLGVSPVSALKELGLDPNHPGVMKAVEAATIHAQRRQLVIDPTLATIKGRAAATKKSSGVAKVAVLNWEPFYNDNYKSSFAARYVNMLLRSLDPAWDIVDEPIGSIDVAINGILADPSEYDLVFGLYSLPFRQSIGLRFVNVPGLRIPLGAVVRSKSKLTWEQIICQQDYANVRVVTLQEEAGFHFMAGACGYPINRDDDVIAEHEADLITQALVEKMDEGRRSGKETFFVADVFTCRAVETKIASWLESEGRPRELRAIDIQPMRVLERRTESLTWVPSYAVGIGLRADAKDFAHLLTEATCVDLFYNAALRMAGLYFDLLRNPGSKELELEPLAFDALGPEHRQRFFEAYQQVFLAILSQQGFEESDLHGTKAAELYQIAKKHVEQPPDSRESPKEQSS